MDTNINSNINSNWKRNIIIFLISQTISMLGSSLVQYAIMWYITIKTQSGLMMTLAIVCGFIPTLLLSPFAGVWADRYNRKLLIMLSDTMIALVTLILAIIYMSGFKGIALLLVVSAFRAFGSAIQGPAVGALLPQLVPKEELTKVNGLNGSIQAAIMIISPIVSGGLLTFASLQIIFFIDVITASIAVFTLLIYLKIPPHEKASKKQEVSYFTDMKLGFNYINNHGFLKKYFIYIGFLLLFVAPAAFLTPLQVTRKFGNDVWRLTSVEIFFSLGMMLGGIIIASWGGFKNRMITMILSNIIMSICTIALGVIPVFWLYLGFMGIFGIAMPMFNTASAVLLQEHVEENYMGRVFSVLSMLFSSMMPLGMLIFGPLSDVIKIEWLLIGTGLIMISQSFFVLKDKELLNAGISENKIILE